MLTKSRGNSVLTMHRALYFYQVGKVIARRTHENGGVVPSSTRMFKHELHPPQFPSDNWIRHSTRTVTCPAGYLYEVALWQWTDDLEHCCVDVCPEVLATLNIPANSTASMQACCARCNAYYCPLDAGEDVEVVTLAAVEAADGDQLPTIVDFSDV